MIAGTLCFVLGLCCGVAIMAMTNFMSDADAESVLDLTDGHSDA